MRYLAIFLIAIFCSNAYAGIDFSSSGIYNQNIELLVNIDHKFYLIEERLEGFLDFKSRDCIVKDLNKIILSLQKLDIEKSKFAVNKRNSLYRYIDKCVSTLEGGYSIYQMDKAFFKLHSEFNNLKLILRTNGSVVRTGCEIVK